VGKRRLDASGSGQGPVVGCCGHGNEPLGSIKGGKFLDQLSDYYWLPKNDSVAWSNYHHHHLRSVSSFLILQSGTAFYIYLSTYGIGVGSSGL